MGSLAVCFVFRGDTVMKLGHDFGKLSKMKKMRKIFTPVLIIALVLCGLWLPDVKVKAWQPGDPNAPATLKIRINADGGTTGLYENDEIVVTSIDGNSEFYNFTIPVSSCGNIPAKNGVLASEYQVVNYSSFYWNYTEGLQINDTFDLSFNGVTAISLLNVSSHIFGSEGEATIEFKAIYPADASPDQIHYNLYNGGPRTNGNLLWASTDEQHNWSYYYDVTVPALSNLVNPYTDGRNLTGILRYYGNGTVYSQNFSTSELHAGNSYQIKLTPADSTYMTFYPEFDSAIIPVTFDAGDKGTIGDSNSSTLTQNLTFTLGDGGNYYSVDITTLPAINDLPNGNYSANGKWTKDSSFSSFADVRELNGPYDAIINGDISTGFNLFLFADDVIQDEETYNLKFNALYDETLSLTVNFAVDETTYNNFSTGSKYLTPLTLSITKPEQTPEYYEFTIPGNDIDEISIVNDTDIDHPSTFYLKSFTPDSNMIYGSAQSIPLGEDAVIRVKSSAFQNNAASLTLTAGFSGAVGWGVIYSQNLSGSVATLNGFTTIGGTTYGVFTDMVDSSCTWPVSSVTKGLIKSTGYWKYVGNEGILIRDFDDNEITELLANTQYRFYIPKTIMDERDNTNHYEISVEPIEKAEFSATFNAGSGGTIKNEGSATTKTVTITADNYVSSENAWSVTNAQIPEITAKSGYVFKKWTMQELPDTVGVSNKDNSYSC